MKLSRAQTRAFRRFVAECDRLQAKWGLQEWEIAYRCEEIQGAFADSASNLQGRCATIRFNPAPTNATGPLAVHPEASAKHEMIHMLLADLREIATWRYTYPDAIITAEESVIRRLEKLL